MLLVAAAPNELTAAEKLLRADESESAAEVAAANAEAAPLVDGLDPPDTASVLGCKEAGMQSCWRRSVGEGAGVDLYRDVVRVPIKRGVVAGTSALSLSSAVDDGAELVIVAGVVQGGVGCTVAGV